MKNIFISIKKKSFYAKVIFLLTSLALMSGRCIFLDQALIMQIQQDGTQAPVAQVGSIATFTIIGRIDCQEDGHKSEQFVISVLAPKSWKLRDNAKVTYITSLYSNPEQELSMSVIPESSLPKNGDGLTWGQKLMTDYGVGPNALSDMEWVSYATDRIWSISNGEKPTYTVYIRTNVGTQNLKAYLGFFANYTGDGIGSNGDYKQVVFSKTPFEVVGGKGITIDYCNNHFNKVQPLAILQDDFVTFTFNGKVYKNDLVAFDEIYLEAVAYDYNGAIISKINEKSDKTLLKRESPYSNILNLTIWPADFFHVPEGMTIDHIEYIFTDKSGTVTITQSDDDHAVSGVEIPAEKQPFQFELLCY